MLHEALEMVKVGGCNIIGGSCPTTFNGSDAYINICTRQNIIYEMFLNLVTVWATGTNGEQMVASVE